MQQYAVQRTVARQMMIGPHAIEIGMSCLTGACGHVAAVCEFAEEVNLIVAEQSV